MGEITRARAIEILLSQNPISASDRIGLYVDCFMDYQEAQRNIIANGNIVLHPRTGAPIANPYADVKARAMSGMLKVSGLLGTDMLWIPAEQLGDLTRTRTCAYCERSIAPSDTILISDGKLAFHRSCANEDPVVSTYLARPTDKKLRAVLDDYEGDQ